MQRVFTLIGHLVMKLLATRLRTLLQLTAFMMVRLALIFTFPDLFSLSPAPLTRPVQYLSKTYLDIIWIDTIRIIRANCVYVTLALFTLLKQKLFYKSCQRVTT